jgi:hypothetical protein
MQLEGDGSDRGYNILLDALTMSPNEGLTCDIGVRRGKSSQLIIEHTAKFRQNHTHVAIDPYGSIGYHATTYLPPGITDYSNQMRRETFCNLSTVAMNLNVNLFFLPIEDSEFFIRFADGVPVYQETKRLVNDYGFVFIDGQHSLEAVKEAVNFFSTRMVPKGVLVFDNTNVYEHYQVHVALLLSGFTYISELEMNDTDYKKVYQYNPS